MNDVHTLLEYAEITGESLVIREDMEAFALAHIDDIFAACTCRQIFVRQFGGKSGYYVETINMQSRHNYQVSGPLILNSMTENMVVFIYDSLEAVPTSRSPYAIYKVIYGPGTERLLAARGTSMFKSGLVLTNFKDITSVTFMGYRNYGG